MTPEQHRDLYQRISIHLARIQELFRPGAKITIIIRNPMVNDDDVLLGDDNIELAITAIRRLAERPPTIKAGT
jgi:pyoverdine/dityrosine biosynthesis protein Dit1